MLFCLSFLPVCVCVCGNVNVGGSQEEGVANSEENRGEGSVQQNSDIPTGVKVQSPLNSKVCLVRHLVQEMQNLTQLTHSKSKLITLFFLKVKKNTNLSLYSSVNVL